jgi:succinoglycan biosynthesis transport protein ExoP
MMIDDELNPQFTRRLKKLRPYWRKIFAGACGCALVALIVSFIVPKTYRATTYIMVSESKIGPGSKDSTALQLAVLPTFIPFVDNDSLINETIRKFRLDSPPHNLSVDRFRRRNYLDVRVPKSTRLLEINVEFPDARLAADLANALTEGAVEFNDRMNATDTSATQIFLKKHLDQAIEDLTNAAARRVKVREDARIEDRERDLQILLTEKNELTARLGDLRMDLAQDESRSTSLKQALASEPPTILLKKSITADRFLEAAVEKLNLEKAPLAMTEESPNRTREEMQRDFVGATVSIAAESAAMQTATARLKRVNEDVSQLITRLVTLRSDIDRAEQDYALASEAVKNASHEYQTASITVSSKSQDMKQIAPALVPERPVRPSILLNTLVGFVMGVLVFACVALVIENRHELHRETVFMDVGSVTAHRS